MLSENIDLRTNRKFRSWHVRVISLFLIVVLSMNDFIVKSCMKFVNVDNEVAGSI